MILISSIALLRFLHLLQNFEGGETLSLNASTSTLEDGFPILCPPFSSVEHGMVKITDNGLEQIAVITCNEGYDLVGAPMIYCVAGKWEYIAQTECSKRCYAPPYVKDGSTQIEGEKDENGHYHKGTLATYSCLDGFYLSPTESKFRVCEKGIWTGPYASCLPWVKITGCPPPKEIANGYFVHEKTGLMDGNGVGQRLHYNCKSGYSLTGTTVQQCLEDGTWSPKIAPTCAPTGRTQLEDYACTASPNILHSYTTVVQGFQTDNIAVSGTIVQIHCISKYRNQRAPCQAAKLRCVGGKWIGPTPICVLARECESPPEIPYAVNYNSNPTNFETNLMNKYLIGAKVSYRCVTGYTMQGNEDLTCSTEGCWMSDEPPSCYRSPNSYNNYLVEVNSLNAVLISAATGAGVLALLLVICLITVCRRRKLLTRAVPIAPPIQRTDLGDHATLLHHPDRLALIAFADGLQYDQSPLPTYDEATRDRALGPGTTRLHRPHWPNLGGRIRGRNNPEGVHVTRHGSFASHTPSTRSAGDSMGSTDTVAASEGSTNVTLDTASSHSGSQPASCRGHCGSLASFDTSSVANTEGVPLLEESELEEMQGDDNVSIMNNPSISDNASFKLSITSADMA